MYRNEINLIILVVVVDIIFERIAKLPFLASKVVLYIGLQFHNIIQNVLLIMQWPAFYPADPAAKHEKWCFLPSHCLPHYTTSDLFEPVTNVNQWKQKCSNGKYLFSCNDKLKSAFTGSFTKIEDRWCSIVNTNNHYK